MITSSTSALITLPNAAPMTTATARSIMFPLNAKDLNSDHSVLNGNFIGGVFQRMNGNSWRGAIGNPAAFITNCGRVSNSVETPGKSQGAALGCGDRATK